MRTMNSDSEVRRVRKEMSAAANHDVRQLIAMINEGRAEVVSRIIDPGTEAEHSDAHEVANHAVPRGESSAAAR